MNIYSDELFLYTKKADISFKELTQLVSMFASEGFDEQEVIEKLKKELKAKIKRRMNKKFP